MTTHDQEEQSVSTEPAVPAAAAGPAAAVGPEDEPTAVVVPAPSSQHVPTESPTTVTEIITEPRGEVTPADPGEPPAGGWVPPAAGADVPPPWMPPSKISAKERFTKSPKVVLAAAVLFTAVASSGLTAGIMSATGDGSSTPGVTVQQGGPGTGMRGGGGFPGGGGFGGGQGGFGSGQGTTDQGTTDQGTTDQGTTDQGTADQGTTQQGATGQGTQQGSTGQGTGT
ncbi:hypothetical protein AMIS_67260 [Actinoplanes missouriensis 431]|uniref:Uncharacterized protein n=1 Tax=Actinoplanes missouriensis (strain ATCC 14538 / DSM 43046 / CBS 188.64 / JCM 3121 / NBRC 102363 / NCIMB 12654 / NRRL B-3342 / UNCC 431) TaxID=512565 RepID=I0HG09_ACTM4|nr:hypothetical protein [Actinoplanes missouriensis]BAL91946.1 hypothetical protein AMIS_67260 [Actinoplanes missouriensis 431]